MPARRRRPWGPRSAAHWTCPSYAHQTDGRLPRVNGKGWVTSQSLPGRAVIRTRVRRQVVYVGREPRQRSAAGRAQGAQLQRRGALLQHCLNFCPVMLHHLSYSPPLHLRCNTPSPLHLRDWAALEAEWRLGGLGAGRVRGWVTLGRAWGWAGAWLEAGRARGWRPGGREAGSIVGSGNGTAGGRKLGTGGGATPETPALLRGGRCAQSWPPGVDPCVQGSRGTEGAMGMGRVGMRL